MIILFVVYEGQEIIGVLSSGSGGRREMDGNEQILEMTR